MFSRMLVLLRLSKTVLPVTNEPEPGARQWVPHAAELACRVGDRRVGGPVRFSRRGQTMIKWDYDEHEILADGIVHGLGVIGGLVGVIALLALAAPAVGLWELTSVAIYGGGLLAVLVI